MAISDKTNSNDNGNTMQEQFAKLQDQLNKGAIEASSYLDSLTAKFTDYDNAHKSSKDTATSYFQSAMDQARASIEQLKKAGEGVRSDGTDSAVNTAKGSVDKAGIAFDNLGKSAQAYDKHVHDSINKNVDDAKQSGSSTLSSWQDSISSLVTSTRDATFHGFESLQDQIAATTKVLSEQASAAQSQASKAADGFADKATEAAEAANQRDSSKKTADEDTGPTLMERATGAVSSSLDYVTSTFVGTTDSSGDKKTGTKSS